MCSGVIVHDRGRLVCNGVQLGPKLCGCVQPISPPSDCPRSWTLHERFALVGVSTNVGSSTEALMTPARLHLTDGTLLRLLMRWAPAGRSLTIRQLAERVGTSKSKISALLSGERATVTPETARRISGALGVHERALFFEQRPRPRARAAIEGKRHEHERAVDADAPRGSQELGRYDGPIGAYRRRA
ncbi:helix-turn-helix domain-containing protein [Streptomyces caniferus]|uniref:helix-turn-helix domain-containing protein n=1 Tax=Streptomyces caniferus TaxID=285557 RepID=UPI0037FB9172